MKFWDATSVLANLTTAVPFSAAEQAWANKFYETKERHSRLFEIRTTAKTALQRGWQNLQWEIGPDPLLPMACRSLLATGKTNANFSCRLDWDQKEPHGARRIHDI